MSSLRRSVLVALITTLPFDLLVVVECRSDNWYPKICLTGLREQVAFDDQGRISLGCGTPIVAPEGNSTDYTNESDTQGEGGGGRWLRRSTRTPDVSYASYASYIPSSPDGTTAALPWTRQTQQQQNDGGIYYGLDSLSNLTVLPPSRNDSDSPPPQFLRPCLCHPNQLYQNFYGPNETVPDLYLCPASAGYCGIPLPGNGPVACFSVSVQEIVAVNAWPIVLLWYLGMLLICCCTIHGNTSIDFCRSYCDPQRNRRNVDRIMAQNASSQPSSRWNVWAWQNYRFEQNLLVQARMILRYEDFARNQLRREQGFPPPSYEMKTKRYSKDCCASAADDNCDDDSIHEPSCTICFVPLEDGDIVGDLACQHIFHKACLKSWCTRKNACPLCNTILATRRRDPLAQDGAAANSNNNA